ncbi:hypothetical protein FKP32DRAFT_1544232, partial [Trametes sanguinea]
MIRSSDIGGIEVPGVREAIKATLFADDTTAYLGENDDFATLQTALDVWCSASKAKFNIKKTEIIPIGTKEYRDAMVNEYRVTGKWKAYPENANMAGEGDKVRLLGAYIGNGIANETAWSKRLDKIEITLRRWAKHHTTLEGKVHAIQMVVGSTTQFATDVQSMPATVAQKINRMTREYLWNGAASPPVKLDQLY